MIRWFVKRVVKFILEALVESEDLDKILEKVAKAVPDVTSSIKEIGSVNMKELSKSASGGDEVDSTAALVGYMVAKSKSVEMSGISGSETVTSADEGHDEVMNMMKNMGD